MISLGRGIQALSIAIAMTTPNQPTVSINVPVGLAEFAFKSLPDDAKRELKDKGYDADNFWERLKELGPTEFLTVEGKDGERVQIWLE